MTVRSLVVALVLVLAAAGVVMALSYHWIIIIATLLASFLVEWWLQRWDRSTDEWASQYADAIAARLEAALSKAEPDDEARRIQILRRHIVDALLCAIKA
ncbi:MAG: hypothetical protein RI947_1395 [Candidatus Parcubacteria bacterium]|jgi:hypothetical protein